MMKVTSSAQAGHASPASAQRARAARVKGLALRMVIPR
jgi:hypothetical protein